MDFQMPIDIRKIDPDLIYALKEAAQMLGISYGTVLKLKKDARLNWLKIGGKYYVKGKDLLEYIGKGVQESQWPGKETVDREL
jgi:excisionase family DNA binding protein